jgi:hypothetical protein
LIHLASYQLQIIIIPKKSKFIMVVLPLLVSFYAGFKFLYAFNLQPDLLLLGIKIIGFESRDSFGCSVPEKL